MTLRIEAGWRIGTAGIGVIGTATIKIVESVGPTTITPSVTTGRYLHTSIASVNSSYSDFATALKTALDAASARTYTVTWNGATGAYTISPDSGTITVEFSSGGTSLGAAYDNMRRILGFSGNKTTASSQTSDIAPYYYISGLMGAKTDSTDDYEPDDLVRGGHTDDGGHYSVSASGQPTFNDFVIPHETKAKVFTRSAPQEAATDPFHTAADVPWTYQHLWQHIRGSEPFLVVDDTDSTVHTLRPEGGAFRPARVVSDWDGAWNLRFATYVDGRL